MPDVQLAGLVVHWHAEDDLEALLDAWPHGDARFELVVVDNGSASAPDLRSLCDGRAKLIEPGGNLGFAGGVNRALRETVAPLVLILNPDARPQPGALETLLARAGDDEQAAGLVPRLVGSYGEEQCRWQLRPLPTLFQLLRQAVFLPGPSGPRLPPPSGSPVQQPAAAALLLRRRVLEELGGFDEGFHPAWHEDVDLAARLSRRGGVLRYVPEAVFVHGLGGSVGPLGYGRFLRAYYGNLARYVAKHHGAGWALLLRALLVKAALLRALLLPLRTPSRAGSRAEAARALLSLSAHAARGFPRPDETPAPAAVAPSR